jgi:hypothetical protein
VLNFEKFEGVGLFRLTPLRPGPGYPREGLEPAQSLTEKKVWLITKKVWSEAGRVLGVNGGACL